MFRHAFDAGELEDLCFQFDIDYQSLRGETKDERARALVEYFRRRHALELLLERCIELRPNLPWPQL